MPVPVTEPCVTSMLYLYLEAGFAAATRSAKVEECATPVIRTSPIALVSGFPFYIMVILGILSSKEKTCPVSVSLGVSWLPARITDSIPASESL